MQRLLLCEHTDKQVKRLSFFEKVEYCKMCHFNSPLIGLMG